MKTQVDDSHRSFVTYCAAFCSSTCPSQGSHLASPLASYTLRSLALSSLISC